MSQITKCCCSSFSNQTHKLLLLHRDDYYSITKPKARIWPKVTKLNSSSSSLSIRNQMIKPSTFSSRIYTDIPLYESHGASFDQYLEDKPRVFQAIFPDKRRFRQLNEEEWRVQMLPIQFIFLTAWPVIDMRLMCKTQGKDYPSGVPRDVTKVLELGITRWKLEGLDKVLEPSDFSLSVKGALYPDRSGVRSRLKGQLEMNISLILPPMMSMVPKDVLQNVAESVLKTLVENMKDKVNGSLLEDYSKFRREKSKSLLNLNLMDG